MMILRLMTEKRDQLTQVAMLQCERNEYGGKGFSLRLLWRSGAGYIGGWTAYLAIRSGRNLWAHQHTGARRKFLEFGVTRNANIVPYAARY